MLLEWNVHFTQRSKVFCWRKYINLLGNHLGIGFYFRVTCIYFVDGVYKINKIELKYYYVRETYWKLNKRHWGLIKPFDSTRPTKPNQKIPEVYEHEQRNVIAFITSGQSCRRRYKLYLCNFCYNLCVSEFHSFPGTSGWLKSATLKTV